MAELFSTHTHTINAAYIFCVFARECLCSCSSYLFGVNSGLPRENVQSIWHAEQQHDTNIRFRLRIKTVFTSLVAFDWF